jgi:hypothetical protein
MSVKGGADSFGPFGVDKQSSLASSPSAASLKRGSIKRGSLLSGQLSPVTPSQSNLSNSMQRQASVVSSPSNRTPRSPSLSRQFSRKQTQTVTQVAFGKTISVERSPSQGSGGLEGGENGEDGGPPSAEDVIAKDVQLIMGKKSSHLAAARRKLKTFARLAAMTGGASIRKTPTGGMRIV